LSSTTGDGQRWSRTCTAPRLDGVERAALASYSRSASIADLHELAHAGYERISALCPPSDRPDAAATAKELFYAADKRLYQAKRAGRDRVAG
jgi:hypothetical protein